MNHYKEFWIVVFHESYAGIIRDIVVPMLDLVLQRSEILSKWLEGFNYPRRLKRFLEKPSVPANS